MSTYNIKRGLNVPMQGQPSQTISEKKVSRVAVLFEDFRYFSPELHCKDGEKVFCGQTLATDRAHPKVRITAPGSGLLHLCRGEKRALKAAEIELDQVEESPLFSLWKGPDLDHYTREQLIDFILESGLFSAFRQRPFGVVPDPLQVPCALFITAIDTRPLSADPAAVLAHQASDFELGLKICRKLVDCEVYLCKGQNADLPAINNIQVIEFKGKHPAGLVGTHIHFLRPASLQHRVWHIDCQDVAALGKLFKTGQLPCERVIALGGEAFSSPRLIQCRTGASITELLESELIDFKEESFRIIDGSPLYGRAIDNDSVPFLSRFSQQISSLKEDRERHFLGWMAPGNRIFSAARAFTSRFFKPSHCQITSSTHGEARPLVPIEQYERVMPLRLEPSFLLRALLTDDLEQAIALGALELEEEDLSLCSFVSPGKEDFGLLLRRTLDQIWKENQ